ncbi:triose-phosphate isomerase [Micrococcus endophyticus]|uniref:Triosephosphate isomerase n=1 Tax=Micrococcus endophyticus TaxID=455343 RepID=A0A7W9MZY9_9MICC|nr:triose-phosphate isomerase [Micrococcus endophyticus]MBB5848173.1 triosephosphate isomerase [Micrococcus endophyticus]
MAETTARVPLIAGNWKMNLDHREAVTLVQRLAWLLTDADHDHEDVEVAVFPPFTDLRAVQVLVTGDRLDVAYGAQDLSPEDSGAYTGDVSGAFLAALGCRYAIVGHSERRTIHGEDDALVARKAAAALRHGLSPVVCVGEGLDVRQAGRHVAHTVAQLEGSLVGLSAEDVARTVVAYEPVWAIGTGEVAGAGDAQEMCAALRARVGELHGDDVAAGLRILYGGSVKSTSAPELLTQPDVDGALVGGASLDAEEFAKIVRFDQA